MVVSGERKKRLEFGDFQTPDGLAVEVCQYLSNIGINPDILIEPTCGLGSFVIAAAKTFSLQTKIYGYEINKKYLNVLRERLPLGPSSKRIYLEEADFFRTNWEEKFYSFNCSVLVLGNFPWVTNSKQGEISGKNIPIKSNFKKHNGLDAITGRANFDISEWMFIRLINCFRCASVSGNIAMLVKTSVARKILSYINSESILVEGYFLIRIDAKKHFTASVDACLLVVTFPTNTSSNRNYDYKVFNNFNDSSGSNIGHRLGLTVSDLDKFDKFSSLLGRSPQKWRSGVKHDASSVMEFDLIKRKLVNRLGEVVDIESKYLLPLLKGSDVGNNKRWRKKYVLVTQKYVGEPTDNIKKEAPLTWRYLLGHADVLDARKSSIYKKSPRFSVFGVGEYSFQPWKIAICGFYKKLNFQLIGPIEGLPVMFDDTIYFLSFDNKKEAKKTIEKLNAKPSIELLSSLIFWDEKRPIKANILNTLDWSQVY